MLINHILVFRVYSSLNKAGLFYLNHLCPSVTLLLLHCTTNFLDLTLSFHSYAVRQVLTLLLLRRLMLKIIETITEKEVKRIVMRTMRGMKIKIVFLEKREGEKIEVAKRSR